MDFINMFVEMFSDWPKIDLAEGAFYAVFGFLFVFIGIALLICIIMLVGLVMSRVALRREKSEEPALPPVPAAEVPEIEDGIPPEVVAAIVAALTVATQTPARSCGFVVKRIRRI